MSNLINPPSSHMTVLREEAVAALGLKLNKNSIVIDGTFGRGGHSELILKNLDSESVLIGIDKDLEAIKYAQDGFVYSQDARFKIIHESFKNIDLVAERLGVLGKVTGVLLDLGVSSPQIDQASRGMSFMNDGPLDMRMDQSKGLTCAEFLKSVSEEDLANILFKYGDEKFSRKIAKEIIVKRDLEPILTTGVLAKIISAAIPFRFQDKHKHPATRTFQALRIYLNQELEDLEIFLEKIEKILAPNGRLIIISFHSLEDRIVKNFFNSKIKGPEIPRDLPIPVKNYFKPCWQLLDKKTKPSESELLDNARARSAILRAGIFLGNS